MFRKIGWMSKGLLIMPNVFEFSVDDERMNAFTNFLSQTKFKNSTKKAHPWAPFNHPKFLHMKRNVPFKCFRNPLQCSISYSIHRLKFQKTISRFPGSRLFISKPEKMISCEIQSKLKPYPLPFWSAMPVKCHIKFLLHVKITAKIPVAHVHSENSYSSCSFRKLLQLTFIPKIHVAHVWRNLLNVERFAYNAKCFRV